eukprot:jgi/Hompol1/3201/HPOL_003162-RA
MYLFGAKVLYHLTYSPPFFALAVAYTAHNAIFKGFLGESHIECLCELLDPAEMLLVVNEITRHVELIIQHMMGKYIDDIHGRVPTALRFPNTDAKLAGTADSSLVMLVDGYDALVASFKGLLAYGELKSEILQAFREIGNALALIKVFEDHMTARGSIAKIVLNEFVSSDPSQKAYFDYLKDFEQQIPLEDHCMSLTEMSARVTGLARHTLRPVQYLRQFVAHVSKVVDLVGHDWKTPTETGVSGLSHSKLFARVWAGLSFAACVPSLSGNDRVVRELFGDGLVWAGGLFLHILRQDSIFATISYTTHVLSMARSDLGTIWPLKHTSTAAPQTKSGLVDQASSIRPEIQQFLDNATLFGNANDMVLMILKILE